MRTSITVEATKKEILRLGGTIERVVLGGKHYRVFWLTPKGHKQIAVCSASTSDWRAEKKAVSLVRQMVRKNG